MGQRWLSGLVLLAGVSGLWGHGAGRLQDAYGICAHVSRWEWPHAEASFRRMREAGILWARTDYDWQKVEPVQGRWSWQALDELHGLARRHGVRILPILGYRTRWSGFPWKNLEAWGAYVRQLALRYPEDLPCMEIWNEENIPAFWFGEKPNAAFYTSLLKRAYAEIKAVNPKVTVLFGGTAGVPLTYIEACLKAGAGNYLDGIAIHPYKWHGFPEDMLKDYAALKTLMDRYGIGHKELWISEVGWSTAHFKDICRSPFTEAFRHLGIPQGRFKLAAVVDEKHGLGRTIPVGKVAFADYFTGIHGVKVSELADLNPAVYPVLVPSLNETFAVTAGTEGLKAYLKKGGTLVLPAGLPFYYDTVPDGKTGTVRKQQIGARAMPEFHLGWETWWTEKGVPRQETWTRPAPGFAGIKLAGIKPSGRFWTSRNLHPGDRYVPLVLAGNKEYSASIAGIYKLNSELKGNIVVSSVMPVSDSIPEEHQARFLPRTYLLGFASGVRKILWYNLRASEKDVTEREDCFGILHKDLAPKPAFQTYKTLTAMCPNGSTVPELSQAGNRFVLNWMRPDGVRVWALWNRLEDESVTLRWRGRLQRCLDDYGCMRSCRQGSFLLRTSVTYLVGPESVELR